MTIELVQIFLQMSNFFDKGWLFQKGRSKSEPLPYDSQSTTLPLRHTCLVFEMKIINVKKDELYTTAYTVPNSYVNCIPICSTIFLVEECLFRTMYVLNVLVS